MSTAVFADTLVPVNLELDFDFENERSFGLVINDDYDHQLEFSWDNGTTHEDKTYERTIYYELDRERWCDDFGTYKNVTNSLTKVLDICAKVVGSVNNSQAFIRQIEEAKADRIIYENMYTRCYNTEAEMINETKKAKDDLEICTKKLSSSDSNLISCRVNEKEGLQCAKELKEAT